MTTPTPPVRTLRFPVHEIEHSSDADNAVQDLRRVGCSDVRVLDPRYERGEGEDESMVVEVKYPGTYRDLEAAVSANPDVGLCL